MNVLLNLILLFQLLGWSKSSNEWNLSLKENTIYEVNSDIDLKGKTITIPQGCTIIFKRGKIANGKVIFKKTTLQGKILIDAEVEGMLTNEELYCEWFGAKPGSDNDASIGINRALNLAKETGSTVRLRKGVYTLKCHLRLNGIPVGLDTTRYLNHNNLTLEGEGKKTILVNSYKSDVINLGYCKNIKIKNFSVVNDAIIDKTVWEQKKSGVNLCSIVNAINVEVSGLTLSHGVYYPHTKTESGVEYFDGGKGLTIQGSLFENIYVSDCIVDDCIYGLDVTTSYPFFQNKKSKIRVERISINNCYRGCVITGGGNRDESLYHITTGLITIDNVQVKNCFQSISTQQAVATNASMTVTNTKPIKDLYKRPNSNDTWLVKATDEFTDLLSYSWVFNCSQSIGCSFYVDASVKNTNFVLMVQGSYSQAGKSFYHRTSNLTMSINQDYSIVPKIGHDRITEECAVYYQKHSGNIKPHLKDCTFDLRGFRGTKGNLLSVPKELNDEVVESKWLIR